MQEEFKQGAASNYSSIGGLKNKKKTVIGALPSIDAYRKPPHKLEKLDVERIKASKIKVANKGGPIKPT